MKYIIEIEEEPFWRQSALYGEKSMYRAKGFNSLVFDQFGLDKLTPLDKALEEAYQNGYDEAQLIYQNPNAESDYQRGLDDAWEAAKKLFSEMSNTEINLLFPQEWNNGGFKALMALHPQDAIDRIKAYEEQQKADEIKVGDEVEWEGEKIIVTQIFTPNLQKTQLHGIGSNGCVYYAILIEDVKKTERHFPQIAELLEAMKGGAE